MLVILIAVILIMVLALVYLLGDYASDTVHVRIMREQARDKNLNGSNYDE